jgi:biotin synthase-related radical SAM superfamily protein
MKKYTITIFAILGTLALIYVIVGAIHFFMILNGKPVVTQISIPEGGIPTNVLEKNVIEIKLIGNHEFTYKTMNSEESKPLSIDSQVFSKEIDLIIKQIGKNNIVIKLLIGEDEKYKDIVDMLDLFTQNNIKKYAILKDNTAPKK